MPYNIDMGFSRARIFAGIATFAFVATAPAAVQGYDLWFLADYDQASDAAPTSLLAMTVISTLVSDPGEVTDGYVIKPGGDNVPLFNDANYRLYAYDTFTTVPAATASYKTGSYSFYVTAGAAASATPGTLAFSFHDFPLQIPYLSGTSYSQLQLCDADFPRTVTWPAFSNFGTTNDNSISFIVQDYNVPSSLFTAQSSPAGGSAVIPETYLIPGHYYGWSINNTAAKRTNNAGFGTAFSQASFSRRSQGYFEADIKPGWVAGVVLPQNREFGFGEDIVMQVVDNNDNVLASEVVTLGYYGRFSWNTGLSGTRRVRFKGDHWISDSVVVNLTTGTRDLSINLLNGDIDGDNEVSILDYIYLSEVYGQDSSSPTWLTANGDGITPMMCDIDEDNEVSILDYIYLSNNYGLAGS